MSDLDSMKFPIRIDTDHQRDDMAKRIRALEVSRENPVFVKITYKKEKRSNAISRLSHMWYSEVSEQGKEYTPIQVKSIAKLKWGVPIMRQHEEFNTYWCALTQFGEVEREGQEPLVITPAFPTYEKQLELMEILPVTSLMTNPEMSQFMNDFQRVMGPRYELTDPRLEGIEL